MQVELGVVGERWQAGGQRGGEGACRRRWRGQACTGTVAGWVGELLGVGLRDPWVTHAPCSHVGRQVEALGPQGHAPLLLDLLGLLDLLLLLLLLSQVITQQFPLALGQHLSIDRPLKERRALLKDWTDRDRHILPVCLSQGQMSLFLLFCLRFLPLSPVSRVFGSFSPHPD